jgi:hypothetical protein
MAKRKTSGGIQHTSTAPPTSGVPTEAPLRPALTAGSEEAETVAARATNPHATGADRVPLLKAHLSAAQQRAALRKKLAQKRRSSK